MTAAAPTATGQAPRRGRVLLPTIIILGAIVIGFVLFTGFYTDWLWFDSVDKTSVYTTQLITRAIMFGSFGLTMAVVIGGTLWLTYRLRPVVTPLTQEQAGLERYRASLSPFRVLITLVLTVLIALLAGVSASSEWSTFLQWRYATDFGITDPQFGLDLGFYVFTYPFLRFVLGFAFTAVIAIDTVILLVTLNRRAAQRFPDVKDRKGITLYAILRALQLRRLRVPPPRVRRGGAPIERR